MDGWMGASHRASEREITWATENRLPMTPWVGHSSWCVGRQLDGFSVIRDVDWPNIYVRTMSIFWDDPGHLASKPSDSKTNEDHRFIVVVNWRYSPNNCILRSVLGRPIGRIPLLHPSSLIPVSGPHIQRQQHSNRSSTDACHAKNDVIIVYTLPSCASAYRRLLGCCCCWGGWGCRWFEQRMWRVYYDKASESYLIAEEANFSLDVL